MTRSGFSHKTGMNQTARYYRENPPAYTLRFVAFDAEEIGLLGSGFYYEQSLAQGELADTLLMLNLDVTDTNHAPPEAPLITFMVSNLPVAREAYRQDWEATIPASVLMFPIDPELVEAVFGGGFLSALQAFPPEALLVSGGAAFQAGH